jgi:hypothetical protein
MRYSILKTAGLMLLTMSMASSLMAAPLLPTDIYPGGVPEEGLLSSGVTDIAWSLANNGDTLIWIATSDGVSRSGDYGENWVTFTAEHGIGRGGVSGLTAAGPWVCAATVFDTSLADVSGVGGGISVTSNGGDTWLWMEQPIDAPGDTTLPHIDVPTTTPINSIAYDMTIDLSDSSLWIATFGAGFRRYSFADSTWENVPPDAIPFGAYDNLNHRAFAVEAEPHGIWAGSADGVNFSSDHGVSWENFNYSNTQINGEPQITGNWVVALDAQSLPAGGEAVWVGGWATFGEVGDYYGVSVTRDQGATWEIIHDLDQLKVYNFAFDGTDVYAACREGLYKSNRNGAAGSWSSFPEIVDRNTGRRVLLESVYGVRVVNDLLFVGTAEGVAVSTNQGADWEIRHPEPVKSRFYPNPFSPDVFSEARLVFDLARSATVTVELFDFAMEKVKTICDGRSFGSGNGWEIYWDGTDLQGDLVANGVYFCSFVVAGQEPVWSKIMVVK